MRPTCLTYFPKQRCYYGAILDLYNYEMNLDTAVKTINSLLEKVLKYKKDNEVFMYC